MSILEMISSYSTVKMLVAECAPAYCSQGMFKEEDWSTRE